MTANWRDDRRVIIPAHLLKINELIAEDGAMLKYPDNNSGNFLTRIKRDEKKLLQSCHKKI